MNSEKRKGWKLKQTWTAGERESVPGLEGGWTWLSSTSSSNTEKVFASCSIRFFLFKVYNFGAIWKTNTLNSKAPCFANVVIYKVWHPERDWVHGLWVVFRVGFNPVQQQNARKPFVINLFLRNDNCPNKFLINSYIGHGLKE